jgi:hypothetical protein
MNSSPVNLEPQARPRPSQDTLEAEGSFPAATANDASNWVHGVDICKGIVEKLGENFPREAARVLEAFRMLAQEEFLTQVEP